MKFLMHARNVKKKRIVMEKKFVFITKEMLELVEEIKMGIAIKKMYKQPQKCSIQEILENEEDEVLENENSSSDFDCIVFRPRK